MPGLFFEIAVPVEGDSLVVDGHAFRIELGFRRLDAFEMAKAVGAPDQHRGRLDRAHRPRMGRNIIQPQADPAMISRYSGPERWGQSP